MDAIDLARLKDHVARIRLHRENFPPSEPTARERIQSAADYLFPRAGLSFCTLSQIAERAKTTSSHVAECFGSVEGVAVDYLQRNLEAALEADHEYWEAIGKRYPRAADMQLRAWIALVAPDPEHPLSPFPFSSEAMQLAHLSNHKGRFVIKKYMSAVRDKLAKLSCDAFYRDPDGLADKLMTLVVGAPVHAATVGNEAARNYVIETSEDLFKRHWQSK